MVLAKIALRNLREHKTKTLIIGILISIGIFLLIVGNSLIDTLKAGMESSYRDSYTGDLIIHGTANVNFSLFGLMAFDAIEGEIPVIDPDEEALPALDQFADDYWATGLATTYVGYQIDEEMVGFGLAWGFEPESYHTVFPDNLTLIEGQYMESGETGIMINVSALDDIEEEKGIRLHAGDNLIVTSIMSSAGTKIREIPIRAVVSTGDSDGQLSMVSFIDIQTIREMSGFDEKPLTIDDLTAEQQDLLGSVSEADLFGDDIFAGNALLGEAVLLEDTPSLITEIEPEEKFNSWHFLIVRTETPAQADRLQRSLNQYFLNEGIELKADDWQWGAGQTAILVDTVQIILNAVILLISIVSVIIIMNTLVISVSERIPEIGTIRAIGGQKSFVRRMITWETFVTTGVFGVIGVLAGGLVILVFNLIGLQTDNGFLQIMLGGAVFKPVITASSIISSFFAVVVMGIVSSLYPASMAMKIEPVKAMQKG